MSTYTVTVVGPTGKTGRHVARYAVERGWTVRAAARRKPDHGTFVPFDWDNTRTWTAAFTGSHAAYVLIPFNHPGAPERTPELLRVAARSAIARIVLLSSLDVDSAEPDSPLRTAERALESLPVTAAILRPTWFLDNFTVGSFLPMTHAGDLRLPAGEGAIPFVDARDVAAVAVAALAPDGPSGPLPITGPEPLTHHQVAQALGAALGRPVRYTPTSPAEFIELMTHHGFTVDYSQFLADALADVATGALRIPVTDTVHRLLGRPAYSIKEFSTHYARRCSGQTGQ